MPFRTPIKGEVDFSNLSDEKLCSYTNLLQDMIFAYKYIDPDRVSVLKSMRKDVTDELMHRKCISAKKALDDEEKQENISVHRIKPFKKRKI